MSGLGWTFDTQAARYAQARPGYVDALYRAIFAYVPIDAASRVVEVGIGGGQATLPVLQTGCSLTAVEPGEHFSALCREKFRAYPRFSLRTGRFEALEFAPEAYDLVFSATAFHWVEEAVGYPKVFAMLRHGGAFARFANRAGPDRGRPALWAEIQKLYGIYMPGSEMNRFGPQDAAAISAIAARYGFVDTRYALFARTRSFSPQGYTALLGTYSDHIALDAAVRAEFFARIEAAIAAHGGEITIYDTIDLELARKP